MQLIKRKIVFNIINRFYLTKIHQNNTIMVKTYNKHIAPNHVHIQGLSKEQKKNIR